MAQPPKFFVRDATGLFREFGTMDALLFASAMVFALVFTTTQFPWFYGNTGGANMPISLLIVAVPFAVLMLAYWAIGLVMPRTGSDYVWVSRIFHPSVGFAWALLYMFIVFLVAYVGEIASFSFAFSITLTTSGLVGGSSTLTALGNFLGSPPGTFVLAVIFTAIFAVFSVFGSRFIKGVIYVSWIAAIIGMALMWYILSTANPTMFAGNWNTMLSSLGSSATYSAVQTAASSHGWPGVTTGYGSIVGALPLAALFLFGGNYVNAFAGEIKNVKRAIPIALFLSLIFGIIYWSITATLTLNAVGANWMTAVGWGWDNSASIPAAYTLSFPPSQPLVLAVIAYPNLVLTYLMFFTYILGSIAPLFAYFWIPSRYFFAWSFDRAVPSRFASISERFHTPYISIIAIVILAVVLSGLYEAFGWSTIFTMGTAIWGISYVIPGLALMVFPYVKKDLFAKSPGFVAKKVIGIPIVSIIGLLTAIGFGYIGYIAATNPAAAPPTAFGIELTAVVIIVGFAVYFGSEFYHKSKGLDITLAFKEIPPE
jgi:amino acid transporter